MCHKCGGHNIVGPRYHKNQYGAEELEYTCATCGYTWSTPCHDAGRPAFPPFTPTEYRLATPANPGHRVRALHRVTMAKLGKNGASYEIKYI